MGIRDDLGKLLPAHTGRDSPLSRRLQAHGVEWIRGPLGELGLPGFLAYGTYVAEVLGPMLLFVGWKARLAALAIAFDMVMALVLVLRPRLFTINQGGGGWGVELEAMILLVAISVFLLGSGRYRLGRGLWD